ncbi:hypothetical protein NEFER03_0726 [Nematocida sp. LUAm3]|nr:hypothetical protein NEFER03_0726 [Nematocida sp. LUAm3]KAI5175185.1 hypothetical protein NEFER02_1146 [Nematocida sp. LUAm2]KAI5178143.1 hypothetical protein NEFER01_1321 [Nematocida sp. LUAm1]
MLMEAYEAREGYLMFLEESGEVENLEALQYICGKCELNLYIEDNRKGVNYMVSGNSFVLDIFYGKEESNFVQESSLISDNQSMEGSLVQSRERMEKVQNKSVDKVSLSLLDEKWEKYFNGFTCKIFYCLRRKKYLRLYELLKKFATYDGEDMKENVIFGEVVKRLIEVEKNVKNNQFKKYYLEKKIEINYCIEEDLVELVWRHGEWDKYPMCYGVCGDEYVLFGNRYNGIEVIGIIEKIMDSEILWKVLSEYQIFGMRERIDVDTLGEWVDIYLEGEEEKIRISKKGDVYEKDCINGYYTLLMKRLCSLEHFIRCRRGVDEQVEIYSIN